MGKVCDFCGWATRNNIKCSDGRTIMKDAFKEFDGKRVPLVWNHDHSNPENVLGHADLENRDEGLFAYCTFNDSKNGELGKILVKHGDIVGLSIYANHLKQRGGDVYHGEIGEVSMVIKGANPGAYIEEVLVHGDDTEGGVIIFTGEPIELYHADQEEKEDKPVEGETKKKESGKTLQDVFNTMNEEQQNACYAMVGMALQDKNKKSDSEEEDDEGGKDMKHNAFDQGSTQENNVLCHADQVDIINLAKNSQVGTLKNALQIYMDENELSHADAVGGFTQDTSVDGNISWLFPEYKDLRPGAPELITNDQGWVHHVLNKVHKSPISRIRTRQVDIRNIEGSMDSLRAKGYIKGNQKRLSGNFKLARRSTDPQTIYVRNSLHRDDIVDITDFDYVAYLYKIDRMQLDEELATAMLFGDGRDDSDPDKIFPEHIRPIWTDDDIYTIHKDVDIEGAKASLQGTNTAANFGENYIYAEAIITAMLYAREQYKGSGQPDMYCTPHLLNVMLLARDINGRRIYSSVSELASSLNVGAIKTVEQMEGKTRTEGSGATAKTKKLLALVCNMADYALGSTKGGEITHFTDFDLDFNQQKSLIETRVSGANTRLFSAIALEEDITE
ncbi:MAG: HK97 family phage prohead protease [Lachnospiraceae bacterium]|nr:HK97 family phage prohead protease [Lachnospiraceae bacterium]